MTSVLKVVMCLTPGALLSSASRERCITNINESSTYHLKNRKTLLNASVLVPICVNNGEVCLLYTKRSLKLRLHKGQVAFPGGKVDENETVYETALRETEEEIGFPAEDIEIWTKMSELYGRVAKLRITPVVGVLKDFDMEKLKPNEAEVADVFTVPVKVFCDSNNHGYYICYVNHKSIVLPVFSGGKHRVWGLTGLITHLFLMSFLPSEVYFADFLRKKYKLSELMPPKQ